MRKPRIRREWNCIVIVAAMLGLVCVNVACPASAADSLEVEVERLGPIQLGAWGRGQTLLEGSDEYPPRVLLGFTKPHMATIVVDLSTGDARRFEGPGFSSDAMSWPYGGPTKDGVFFASCLRGSMVVYDQKNDTAKMIRPIPKATWLRGMALGPDGRVYVAAYPTGEMGMYDARTGEMANFGLQGGPFNYDRIYGYSIASDGKWVYTATGMQPWYVVAFNLETKEQTILRQVGPTDFPYVIQRDEKVYLKVRLAAGDKDKRWHEFYRLGGGRMEQLEAEPFPWKGPKPAAPATPKIIERPGRTWPLEKDGKPVLRYQMPDGKGGWGEVREAALPIGGDPYMIRRLAPMADGKLLVYTARYGNVFTYDPKTGKATEIGSPAKINVYTMLELDGQIYFAGYPDSPFGTFEDGKGKILVKFNKLLASKHAWHMVHGGDGRIYIGNHAEREAFGGSLGWYDPSIEGGEPGGIRFRNDDCDWLIATGDGKSIVYSSIFVRDPGAPLENKAESGRIMVFNIAEQKIVSTFVPMSGAQRAGMIAEVRPGVILGLAVQGRKKTFLYEADLATGQTRIIKELAGEAQDDLERGPDGKLYTFIGRELVRIDPETHEVTPLVETTPGSMAFAGNDLYLAGDTELRCIRNIAQQAE